MRGFAISINSLVRDDYTPFTASSFLIISHGSLDSINGNKELLTTLSFWANSFLRMFSPALVYPMLKKNDLIPSKAEL